MNNNESKKATRSLTFGDVFTYKGMTGKFCHFTGYPRNSRYGIVQSAYVETLGGMRVWTLNMAGSVVVHDRTEV